MPPEQTLPLYHTKISHTTEDVSTLTIDACRPGYPQFSALISSSTSFLIFRRFLRSRVRVLLQKQDEIRQLEDQLDLIDENEATALFLGSIHLDNNPERKEALSKLERKIADYDNFLGGTRSILQYDEANGRDVSSLRNWVDFTGSISREESAYLSYPEDLFSLAPVADRATVCLQAWIEDRLIHWSDRFRDYQGYDKSTDRKVYVSSGSLVTNVAMALLIALITILLLLPIVICNLITGTASRIVIVMIYTILYLLVHSGLTRAKTTELMVGATTYATVLIVFVSGTNGQVT